MAKRKENHYNNNVIIDNKVVSVSDLQTNAKSASMRFLVLVLGITLLASMVVPYLSMAAAATSTSNAFNGAVIPGYSMGGLELTAYGVSVNSWGAIDAQAPSFVKSNYGIWSTKNVPDNADNIARNYKETNDELNQQTSSSDKLLNTSDKASGWESLTGATNYTNNSPNGSVSTKQNQKYDDISPVRTASDYNYWNAKTPVSNSSNDAKINVSLFPDFVVISKDANNHACVIKSPNDTGDTIVDFSPENSDPNKGTQSKPYYIPISVLMDNYKNELSKIAKAPYTMDDLFKAVSTNNSKLDDIVNNKDNDLLVHTTYKNLNGTVKDQGDTSNAFNPYPYTMVFSTTDTTKNETVFSSIYENCEAYVYFSPSIVYQKYLQVRNEYLSLLNSASRSISNNDAVTTLQIGYYCAAMSILEAYLNESLPQDMTRGYVGMSEDSKVRGKDDGSEVGKLYSSHSDSLSFDSGNNKSFQKVTYATLMYDVSASFSSEDKKSSDCNIKDTDAIMDNLSVFGYNIGNNTNDIPGNENTLSTGVMKGLIRDHNFNRRTNLTPLLSENDGSLAAITGFTDNGTKEPTQAQLKKAQKYAKSQNKIDGFLKNSDNAGFYTPCYYPIQQHKMPDSEKTYRFSILADVPYSTFVKYIDTANGLVQGVKLAYSSNFVSSLKSLKDYVSNGSSISKVELLVQQYNQDYEDTGLDLKDFDASASISIAASEQDQDSETGTGAESIETTTDSNVQTRVDSALQGYAASNMTSDNVHDMVDVARSVPGLKYETFYRNFNPLKSDGSDQDVFIARVTPAVTTYFPATLVKGYENAGGAEVPTSCATSNVSFDYFSIGSFAPCFASHSDSKTYYGSLNYELRAFYRKGFISTLSNTSNTPQVEQFNEAKEQVDQIKKDSKISSETMKTNMKTIFVEAKRLAAGKALAKLQTYKNTAKGKLDMNIVKKYFSVFKGAFQEGERLSELGVYYNKKDDENYYIANKGWATDVKDNDKVTVKTFFASDIKDYDFLEKKGVKNIYWHVGGQKPGDEGTGTFMSADSKFVLSDIVTGDKAANGILLFEQDGHWGTQIGKELRNWDDGHEFAMSAVFSKGSDAQLLGPIYYNRDKFSLVENEQYLIQCDKLFTGKGSKYYWMDYKDLENLQADIAIDHGGDIKNGDRTESTSLFVVGYYPKYLFDDSYKSITAKKYTKAAQKVLDEACQELFKDVTNQLKDEKLLLSSMPSQMQNVLAWADYQNASDSEGQYQADPTDTVDINLDINAKDDYDAAPSITGLSSLEAAGYTYNPDTCEAVSSDASVGATNSAIQARMERGVEGSTWTYSQQPACYTMTAIIARIENMQNSGVSYPYQNLYTGRFKSGTDQYALLQAHVIDYSSISSGISGDLATRVHGKVVSITNPNYGALPDFLNILGTIGGLIAEATSGFANLTGGMFEDVMWNGNGENTTKVATSDNQIDDGTIDTKKYDGTGNIERKGSMWVLDSTGGQNFYTLIQSLALVLVLVSLLYIAFKNFYEYTRPAGASAAISEKDEAGQKSAAAERKILAATQLKVVMPRAIIAVFMIGLPPMSGAGFQGGNFLLLQMLSSIFNQISHVFMNLNGQSVMNLWLNTGADLLSDNPGIGEYIAYGVAMLVIGAMFVVGTLAVLLADVILILFYIIGPLMWALYVWPYNDTTSKTKNPDGIIAKLTSRMKFAWTGGRVGNKAPEGMIECYCETAMLNVMWSVIFWAITIVFTGVTGTIATDTSSTPGNTATLAGAATVSNATYVQSALMSTGNYYASASVAHADGLFNAGILPMPAWVRMLIAAALAVVVFMLMIRMASSMFKKSLGNTFRAVSIVAGGIKGAATGLGGRIAQTGGKLAVTGAKAIAQKAIKDPNTYEKVSRAAHKANDIRKFAGHQLSRGANVARKVTDTGMNLGRAAANLATGKVSGNDALQNMVNKGVRALNNAGAGRLQEDNKRRHGANGLAEEIKNKLDAGDRDGANELLANADPENKRQFLHYHGNLVEKNADGAYQLKSTVDSNQLDKAINDLNEQIDRDELRAKKHIAASQSASRPEQMRKAALEASGIDDVVNAMNILQSEDADDRTKKKMLRKVNDYNRRIYGDGAKHFDENDINDKQKMLEAAHSLRASIPTTAEQVTLMQERIGAADDYLYRIQQSRAYENGTSDIPGNVKLMLKPINDHVSSLALSSSNQFEAVQVIKHDVSKLTDNVLGECRMKGIGEENAIQEAQNAQLQIAGGSFLKSKNFIGGLQDAALGKPTLSGEAGMRQLAATAANLTLLTGDDTVANSLTNHAIVSSSNAILRRVPTGALNDEQRVIYDRVKNRNAAMDVAYKYPIPSDVYQSNMNSEMETLLASNPSLDAIISSGCSYNALLGELSRGSYSTKEVAVITQFANDSLTTMNDNSSFRKTIAATQRNVTGTPEEREENALSYLNPDNCEQNIEDINALKQVPYNNAQVTGDYYLNELNKAREDYDKIVAEREANDKAIDALFKGKSSSAKKKIAKGTEYKNLKAQKDKLIQQEKAAEDTVASLRSSLSSSRSTARALKPSNGQTIV